MTWTGHPPNPQRVRGPDGTLQTRVFELLRTRHSAAPQTIADALGDGITRVQARMTADRLVRDGYATRHMLSPRVAIYAARPRKRAPGDGRGKSPASRNHRGAVAFAKLLAFAWPKRYPGRVFIPKRGHPLDAWANIKPKEKPVG